MLKAEDFPKFGRQEAPAYMAKNGDVLAWGPLIVFCDGRAIAAPCDTLRHMRGAQRFVVQFADTDVRDFLVTVEDARRVGEGVEITDDTGRVWFVRPVRDDELPTPTGEPYVQWFNREHFSEW